MLKHEHKINKDSSVEKSQRKKKILFLKNYWSLREGDCKRW